jgi:hypothetical protein
LKTPGQIAAIIERFLSGAELYAQEFNDFIYCALADPKLDAYRQRCELLHSDFERATGGRLTVLARGERERQIERERDAIQELAQIAAGMRLLDRRSPDKSGE